MPVDLPHLRALLDRDGSELWDGDGTEPIILMPEEAELAAASRNALPALLDELDRARAVVEAGRRAVAESLFHSHEGCTCAECAFVDALIAYDHADDASLAALAAYDGEVPR
jgi:hypothetical protein